MNNEEQIDALRTYFDLMSMNGGARVYRIARHTGIFDAVGSGSSTPQEVAEKCGLHEKPVKLLMDTLCSLRTMQVQEDHYALAPVMEILSRNYQDLSDEYWDHLPQLLETGVPLARMDDPQQSEALYTKQVDALAWMMKPSAEVASVILGIGETRRDLEILDVGAGSAVWSLTCAQKDPNTRVTAVDWPGILKIAEASSEKLGLKDRFRTLPGNYHEVDLPSGFFDLALVGNVTHLETPEGNRALFQKLRRALKADGEIAVFDVMPGQELGDLGRALYALGLALRTEKGHVYSKEKLQEFLRESGFVGSRFSPIEVSPYTMGMILAKNGNGSC